MSSQQFLYAIFGMAAVMMMFRVVPLLFFKSKIKKDLGLRVNEK